jgi:hypothetical protein
MDRKISSLSLNKGNSYVNMKPYSVQKPTLENTIQQQKVSFSVSGGGSSSVKLNFQDD